MVAKKAYELPTCQVIQNMSEDVLTASIDQYDNFFIKDVTDWSTFDQ